MLIVMCVFQTERVEAVNVQHEHLLHLVEEKSYLLLAYCENMSSHMQCSISHS